MTQFLAIITLINQLFPLILQTVRAVEAAFPQGGQGAQKLAIVQGVIQQAIAVSGDIQVSAEKIIPVLLPVINGFVTLLRSTGEFKASVTAQAVTKA